MLIELALINMKHLNIAKQNNYVQNIFT